MQINFNSLAWYVALTKSGEEDRAELNLTNLGWEVVCPRVKNRRRGSVEPLFPRYLFVRTDVAANFGKISSTRGVVRLVGGSDGPWTVDGHIVQSLRDRLDSDGILVSRPCTNGDRVRLAH